MEPAGVDIDALMAEVRERVRVKRARGVYDDELDSLARAPLPGGAPLGDELADPLAALPQYLGSDVRYDPRSRRPVVGPLVTLVRRSAMWLLRWWIHEIVARQDRVNRLMARELELLRSRSASGLDARLGRLEEEWRKRKRDEVAASLDYWHFADRFGGAEELVRELDTQFVPFFKGRRRVLDLGSGRGTFLQLMKERGIGAYGVDSDARLVDLCRKRGLEAHQADGQVHLRGLADAGIDGVFAAHFAEHVEPGYLLDVLRECRRVLAPGSPAVFVTPNARMLSVGAYLFWTDPSHRRPVPPELFHYYLEVAGFVDVEIRTYSRMETRLAEDTGDERMRANLRTLNDTLFGDRDCALIGFVPA